MKLLVGLGNPGRQYADSRHNVGFMVVDELVRRWKSAELRHDRDFEALVGEAQVGPERVLLLKPLTYMNLSGRSASAAARFYKIPLPDVLAVYDDLDLPLGQLRVRAEGSAGGHRGMEDLIRMFGSTAIGRVRVGIGKVHRAATVGHVLGTFSPDERESAEQGIASAADAVECWVREGITTAMNRYNRRPESKSPEERRKPPGGMAEGDRP